MDTKRIIITIVVTFGIIGLMVTMTGDQNERPENSLTMHKNTDIACLTNGHLSLAAHIHPNLSIFVDGEKEAVPANIGITEDCMPEIHTHDETGQIHIESVLAERVENFTLEDFFTVWERPVERPGYDVTFTLNGEPKESAADVQLIDLSEIEVAYTSNGEPKEKPVRLENGTARFELNTEAAL